MRFFTSVVDGRKCFVCDPFPPVTCDPLPTIDTDILIGLAAGILVAMSPVGGPIVRVASGVTAGMAASKFAKKCLGKVTE